MRAVTSAILFAIAGALIAFWDRALARVAQSPEWQRDLERNFWTSNFLTGADAFGFIDRSSQQFRTLWAEIGRKTP